MKLKHSVIRYRAVLVMAICLVFKLIASIYLQGILLEICIMIVNLGQYFSFMMAIYDLIVENAKYAIAVKKIK